MKYTLKNKSPDVDYYVNNIKTILYVHNIKARTITKYYSDKWSSMYVDVVVNKNGKTSDETINLKTLLEKDVDSIPLVTAIASTSKPPAFFKQVDKDIGITFNYLNEFLNSNEFIKAEINNRFNEGSCIISLLRENTPALFSLLNNLFLFENDDVLLNFIRWLRVCCFEDKHQDILFCFFGKNEINQGQGSGKGVLIKFLSKLLSDLVVSVSNKTYENNFNAELMNKKIVIFDEVNFKRLKWESVKDITGKSELRVEFKGKDPIHSKNVSSWIMFTNECDLRNKISLEDRRVFLIRPNPKNGSLLRDVVAPKFGCFSEFERKLESEIDSFVNILALAKGEVRSPLQLMTRAKAEYFMETNEVTVNDFNDIHKLLVDLKFNERIAGLLVHNSLIMDSRKIMQLRSRVLNFSLFKEIYISLTGVGLIRSNKSALYMWERTKEYSLKGGMELFHLDMAETKSFFRYIDKSVLIPSIESKKKIRVYKKNLREIYGKKFANA